MAIYTFFGSEIEIIDCDFLGTEITIKYVKQGFIRTIRNACELKADGGIDEISQAMNKVRQPLKD